MNDLVSFRDLRQQAGLSLTALSRASGVPVGLLSDLERGKGGADPRVLERLAALYGVGVKMLDACCPVPAGLREWLSRPEVQAPPALVSRLVRLEFRGGQTLSADEWGALAESLQPGCSGLSR